MVFSIRKLFRDASHRIAPAGKVAVLKPSDYPPSRGFPVFLAMRFER
jgi:hypothetical protein